MLRHYPKQATPAATDISRCYFILLGKLKKLLGKEGVLGQEPVHNENKCEMEELEQSNGIGF